MEFVSDRVENIMGKGENPGRHDIPTWPFHWNCTIQRVSSINTLKYNSDRKMLHT